MERLAPAVLLVLFDGVPAVVHIEEPRQGIQFGVRCDPEAPAAVNGRARCTLRDASNGGRTCPRTLHDANSVDVPFRRDAPGVINIAGCARRLAAKAADQSAATLDCRDGVRAADAALPLPPGVRRPERPRRRSSSTTSTVRADDVACRDWKTTCSDA